MGAVVFGELHLGSRLNLVADGEGFVGEEQVVQFTLMVGDDVE